ncbi:MAG: copper resistance D family protein, partial [Solirubrobacteraceae bacterium]
LWLPRVRRGGTELRRAVMEQQLPRYGRVALPAFILVALTGTLDAYIQVRHPSLLWGSSYGRTLLVKSALVCVIALLSYTHVFRLRPRLLAANPHPNAKLERRHWRLIGSEPLVGIALALTVALLVSFPTPGQIAAARAQTAQPLAVCNPCVLPAPAAKQLAVAAYAAPETDIVAAWLTRHEGRLEGQVRLLALEGQPASTPFEIVGATVVSPSCGLGCRAFTIPHAPAALGVILNPDRKEHTVTLPARWQRSGNAQARRILDRAQATMRALASVSDSELAQSVPAAAALTRYTLHAPDRLAWSTSLLRTGRPPQFSDAEVQIGASHYSRTAAAPHWQSEPVGDTLPFSVPTWFTWTTHAEMTRLIGARRTRAGPIATVALMDPGAAIWETLQIDLADSRVLSTRLIDPGHSMTDHFTHFNSAPAVLAPKES